LDGSEVELVEQFRRHRDPALFEPLVAMNMGKVRALVYRIVLNSSDVDDLVQESFLRAYQRFDSFRGEAGFSTWLCRIAVNQSLHFMRRKKVRAELPSHDALEQMSGRAGEQPDEQLVGAEERQRAAQAMAQLPAKQRAALAMAVGDEMPAAQIAQIMGCPTATVYWRLHRARRTLAKKLEGMDAAEAGEGKAVSPAPNGSTEEA